MSSLVVNEDTCIDQAGRRVQPQLQAPPVAPNGPQIAITASTFEAFEDLWTAVQQALTSTYFVAAEEAQRLCVELFRGLVCKSYLPNSRLLSLPPLVDLAWHQAVLNTQMYAEMCETVFGRFLHHSTVSAQDPVAWKNRRVTATETLYRQIFKEAPPADLWEREEEPVQEEVAKAGKKRAAPSPEAVPVEKKGKSEERPEGEFQIHILDLSKARITLYVSSDLPVSALKNMIQIRMGIPPGDQRIIYASRQLADNQRCGDVGLRDGVTVHLIRRLRGC
jgi:hypothetical protein